MSTSSKNKKGDKDRSDLSSNRSDMYEQHYEVEPDPEFQKQARKMLERYLDQTIQYDANKSLAHHNSTKRDNSTTQEHESESGIYLLKNSKQCAVFDEFRDIDAPMLLKKKPVVSNSSDSDSESEDERIRSVAVQFNPTSGGFDAKTESSTKNKRNQREISQWVEDFLLKP